MTIDAPTLDTITGHTVMVKMRELIKQMTTFAKEVADLVNTIPTDVQDTYSREAIDEMIQEIDDAIDDITGDITSLMQDKANASDVYTKSEVYTKTETDELLSDKADTSDVYDKTETDELLSAKANASDVYDKTETDTLLSTKANANNVYTKSESDTLLSAKQDELTAGTGISIQNNVISATGGGSSDANVKMITLGVRNTGASYELGNVQDGDIVVVKYTGVAGVTTTQFVVPTGNVADEYMYTITVTSGNINKYYLSTSYTSHRYLNFKHISTPISGGSSTTVNDTPPNDLTGYILRSVA